MDKEFFSLGIFGAGVATDHASTIIGLITGSLVELNPFTNHLINMKIWLLFDVCFLGAISWAVTELYGRWDNPSRWTILALPIVIGAVRLCAGLYNFILLFYIM
jgi:hypothetical protein